jgi:hypothetical protein
MGQRIALVRLHTLSLAKRRVGIEYSPSMLEPVVRPGAVSPDRALYLPTCSHFVIVNNTSLSHTHTHTHTHRHTHTHTHTHMYIYMDQTLNDRKHEAGMWKSKVTQPMT